MGVLSTHVDDQIGGAGSDRFREMIRNIELKIGTFDEQNFRYCGSFLSQGELSRVRRDMGFYEADRIVYDSSKPAAAALSHEEQQDLVSTDGQLQRLASQLRGEIGPGVAEAAKGAEIAANIQAANKVVDQVKRVRKAEGSVYTLHRKLRPDANGKLTLLAITDGLPGKCAQDKFPRIATGVWLADGDASEHTAASCLLTEGRGAKRAAKSSPAAELQAASAGQDNIEVIELALRELGIPVKVRLLTDNEWLRQQTTALGAKLQEGRLWAHLNVLRDQFKAGAGDARLLHLPEKWGIVDCMTKVAGPHRVPFRDALRTGALRPPPGFSWRSRSPGAVSDFLVEFRDGWAHSVPVIVITLLKYCFCPRT